MKKWISPLVLLPLALFCGRSNSYVSTNRPDITPEDLQAQIMLLASDSLQGREAGSAGEALATDFLVREFQAYGLQPAGTDGGFVQPFTLIKGSIPTPEGSFIQSGELSFTSADSSVFPYATSKPGEVSGLLAFAGYGIVDSSKNWNDFAGVDFTGHIAVIFRYGPDGADNPHSEFSSHWGIRKKVRNAAAAGAAGVILVLGPNHSGKPGILPLKEDRFAAEEELPILQMKLSAATQLAADAGISLTNLQTTIDRKKQPAPALSKRAVTVHAGIQKDRREAKNVVGMIRGNEHPEKYVVIGAHYDHLGYGDNGSLYAGPEPKIHNGADDNASGTAGLLELAAWFVKHPPKHSLVFMAFSGEELGLLGSDYWVKNPTLPLENIRAMINMDMIGRSTDRNLQIFGVGSSADWTALIDAANDDSLRLTKTPDGTGASDHTSFYNARIPVLHYFTGTHSDYHRPSDDAQYVNYTGTALVLEHVRRLVDAIDALPADKLAYTEAPVTQTRRVAMTGITLGVLPDYGFAGPGFRITGTSEGKPGAKIGMKAGDVIHNINGLPIKDIYDYMESLNTVKKGSTLTVEIEREAKRLKLEMKVE
jgi:hypothetical protein